MVLAVAVVGVVCVLFVGTRLASNDFDPSRFVLAGVGPSDPDRVPEGLDVRRDTAGFDGQFFYRLALDPLTDARADEGISLDIPSYRQQRIFYPVLVWAVTMGGRSSLLPWALILVNVTASLGLAYFGARLARLCGRSAIWGVPLALVPGCAVALARDTSELVAVTFALGALLLLRSRRLVLAALAMSAAVLTRETALVVPLGLLAAAAVALPRRRRPEWRLVAAAFVPVAVFAAWQLFLWRRWGGPLPVLSGEAAGATPLIGFVRTVVDDLQTRTAEKIFDLGGMVFLAMFLGTVAWAMTRSRVPDHERWAFVGAAVVVILLNPAQWNSHTGYFRAATEASLLGGIVLAGTPGWVPSAALVGSALAWGATAAVGAVFL